MQLGECCSAVHMDVCQHVVLCRVSKWSARRVVAVLCSGCGCLSICFKKKYSVYVYMCVCGNVEM